MKMQVPSEESISTELGAAGPLWDQVICLVAEKFGPVEQEWKPSKTNFGSMCLIKAKKRTLIYVTPDTQAVRIGIVLGERAVQLALASKVPEMIKDLIRDARPYAEGRGIRFALTPDIDANVVCDLIAIKLAPK